MDSLSMLKLPCLTTEYGTSDIEPVEADTEFEGTAKNNAVSGTPTGPFEDELFQFDSEFKLFLDSWPDCENVRDLAIIAGSIRVKVPNWPDWSMIPRIHPEEDNDDAEFLIALLIHCIHVAKDREDQVGEYIADIIIDAFYEYEPFMLLP
ncbi:uncharacterized protein ASPGLDRAFT_38054 [Aspergillus glaucus CBS 516.65]|uniref:Uncharacterized protein n=1 Tax=Aspergillus glaucus CBS 516.65 TaxID=1160497 RepID=A0A1L9VBF2_ASPGL|nr:hypothetical protein ASPGLDRAFT_38054 [Aspergillus glaucus CBS 516.65]OJJ81261.1 hypothetical protein ASPGLDRAFT_38054 [Aspergillus glaucus CBS 516.65]